MRTLLIALAAIGGLLAPSLAAACSCAQPPATDVALANAGAVFEGTVIGLPAPPPEGSLQGGPGQVEYRFNVMRYWKGSPGMEVRVFTNSSGAACGRKYEKGQSYLIYAQMSEEATMSDNICSRTRLLSGAHEDLKVLGEGTAPRRRGGAKADPPTEMPPTDPPTDPPVDPATDPGNTDGDTAADAAATADPADPAAPAEEPVASADPEPASESSTTACTGDTGDDEIDKKSCSLVDGPSPSGLGLLALMGLGLWIRRAASS